MKKISQRKSSSLNLHLFDSTLYSWKNKKNPLKKRLEWKIRYLGTFSFIYKVRPKIWDIQGVSYWTVPFKLALTGWNMQARICLKVVLISWDWIFACIFLSVRANLKGMFQYEIPCRISRYSIFGEFWHHFRSRKLWWFWVYI